MSIPALIGEKAKFAGCRSKYYGSWQYINYHSDITTSSAFTLVLSSSSQGTNGNQSISLFKNGGSMNAYAAILVEKRINVSIHHCEFEDFYSRGVMFTGSGFTSDAVPTVYASGNSFHDNSVINCAEYLGSGKSGWGLGNLEIEVRWNLNL